MGLLAMKQDDIFSLQKITSNLVGVPYLLQTVQIITMETKHFVVVAERLAFPAL
jgi:hypothetical protein